MTEQPPEAPAAYTVYTVAQLARILQVDPRTVQTRTRAGTWPHLRIGPKTVRFTAAHLDTIITTTEAAPPPERSTRRRTRRAS